MVPLPCPGITPTSVPGTHCLKTSNSPDFLVVIAALPPGRVQTRAAFHKRFFQGRVPESFCERKRSVASGTKCHVLGVYWACIGRVLDDVWTTVRVIGMCIGRCMDNSQGNRYVYWTMYGQQSE